MIKVSNQEIIDIIEEQGVVNAPALCWQLNTKRGYSYLLEDANNQLAEIEKTGAIKTTGETNRYYNFYCINVKKKSKTKAVATTSDELDLD